MISQCSRILNLSSTVDRLPTCVGYKSFGFTFDQLPASIGSQILQRCRRPTADFHRLSIIGGASEPTSNFPRRLHSPALLSSQLPTFIGYCILRPCQRTNFQLFVGHLIFQLTFRPTSDSHRILHRPVLPSDRPPTFIGYRILRLYLRINFRFSSDTASSGSVSDQPSNSIGV